MDDHEASKIHGYIDSDYDDYSSNSNEESDFDDVYCTLQPPPIPMHEFEQRLVQIKAVKDKTESHIKVPGWKALSSNITDVPENYHIHFPPLSNSNDNRIAAPNNQIKCDDKLPSVFKKKLTLKKCKSIDSNLSPDSALKLDQPRVFQKKKCKPRVTSKHQKDGINFVTEQIFDNFSDSNQSCNIIDYEYNSINPSSSVLEESVTTVRKVKKKFYENPKKSNKPYHEPKKSDHVIIPETFIIPEIEFPKNNNRNYKIALKPVVNSNNSNKYNSRKYKNHKNNAAFARVRHATERKHKLYTAYLNRYNRDKLISILFFLLILFMLSVYVIVFLIKKYS